MADTPKRLRRSVLAQQQTRDLDQEGGKAWGRPGMVWAGTCHPPAPPGTTGWGARLGDLLQGQIRAAVQGDSRPARARVHAPRSDKPRCWERKGFVTLSQRRQVVEPWVSGGVWTGPGALLVSAQSRAHVTERPRGCPAATSADLSPTLTPTVSQQDTPRCPGPCPASADTQGPRPIPHRPTDKHPSSGAT